MGSPFSELSFEDASDEPLNVGYFSQSPRPAEKAHALTVAVTGNILARAVVVPEVRTGVRTARHFRHAWHRWLTQPCGFRLSRQGQEAHTGFEPVLPP
jgi:hypothetical protein